MGILSRAESFIKIRGHEKKTTLRLDFHAIRTQHGHPLTPVDSSKSCFFCGGLRGVADEFPTAK